MELRGNIKDFPLPDIVQLLGAGRKTGMLLITFKKQKASVYFKNGDIVHAKMLNAKGREAITKMFHIEDGRFHYYAGVVSDTRTIRAKSTAVLMEALSIYDEKREERGHYDKTGKKKEKHAKKIKTLKLEMIKTIKDHYGNKVKKLENLINKCGNSEIELMSLCDKIEKYIFVFLDSQNFKSVADRIRHLIEETH